MSVCCFRGLRLCGFQHEESQLSTEHLFGTLFHSPHQQNIKNCGVLQGCRKALAQPLRNSARLDKINLRREYAKGGKGREKKRKKLVFFRDYAPLSVSVGKGTPRPHTNDPTTKPQPRCSGEGKRLPPQHKQKAFARVPIGTCSALAKVFCLCYS